MRQTSIIPGKLNVNNRVVPFFGIAPVYSVTKEHYEKGSTNMSNNIGTINLNIGKGSGVTSTNSNNTTNSRKEPLFGISLELTD